MGSKEEVSDTNSGIILHSTPDSPGVATKDVITHTRAMKLKHQSLEDQLELCLLELKKLCIREAELTGKLSADYPLLPGEKPPHIRQRIGAAFKLDEESILQEGEQDSELRSLEADLALQQKIYEAARKLSLEEHLSKQVKRSRLHQVKCGAKKLKELQEAVFQLRLQHVSSPTSSSTAHRDLGTSHDSSQSDAALLDEEESTKFYQLPLEPTSLADPLQPPQGSPQPPQRCPRYSPPQALEGLGPCYSPSLMYESSPIQNSPWKESSLDQPYEKPKKSQSTCSSQSGSPAVTPVSTPVEPQLGDAAHPFQFVPIMNLGLRQAQSNSAPSTPDLHIRRQHSQSFRLPKGTPSHFPDQTRGCALLPQRRLTEFTAPSSEYWHLRPGLGNVLYHSSSDDGNSEYSVLSYASSSGHEIPADVAASFPHGYHYVGHQIGPLAFTGSSFYKNVQHQSTHNFYRGCVEEGIGYPPEINTGRLYTTPPLGPVGRFDYWYEEPQQWLLRPGPPQIRLARAPSLKEYSHLPSRGMRREVVSEELKSWHQRNQFRGPCPRSLDRQGVVRVRTLQGRESPLCQDNTLPEEVKVPQRRILQRAPDGTPMQWFVEDDSEIMSQV